MPRNTAGPNKRPARTLTPSRRLSGFYDKLEKENNSAHGNRRTVRAGGVKYAMFAEVETTPRKKSRPNKEADKQALLNSLGIDNMRADDYLSSSFDKPHLVHVKVVDVLKAFNCRGLFANQDILSGTCLGVYTGEEYTYEAFAANKEKNPDFIDGYSMRAPGGIIDGGVKGNFTRFINCSDSQANMVFQEAKNSSGKAIIKVFSCKDVKKGQQLLIDYNTYEEKDAKSFYFLNPQDGWESAQELLLKNANHYILTRMPAIPLLAVEANESLFTTVVGQTILASKLLKDGMSLEQVNLPLLRHREGAVAKDFSEVDCFTPLMLASYYGQVANVRWLIKNHAAIDQQQTKSGNCSLFIALEGYQHVRHSRTNFFAIIKTLIENGANVLVHDRTDQIAIHKMISILSADDFAKVLSLIKTNKNTKEIAALFSYIDEHDSDIFIHCLKNKDFAKAQLLLEFYPDFFKKNYDKKGGLSHFNKKTFTKIVDNYSDDERGALLAAIRPYLGEKLLEELNLQLTSSLRP